MITVISFITGETILTITQWGGKGTSGVPGPRPCQQQPWEHPCSQCSSLNQARQRTMQLWPTLLPHAGMQLDRLLRPQLQDDSRQIRQPRQHRPTIHPCHKVMQFFTLAVSHISRSLRESAVNLEYVDLEKLLPKPLKIKGKSKTKTLKIMDDQDGFSIEKQDDSPVIDGLIKWVCAYLMYMLVAFEGCEIEKCRQMVAHGLHIVDADKEFKWPAIYKYDVDLRWAVDLDPDRNWAVKDFELWGPILSKQKQPKYNRMAKTNRLSTPSNPSQSRFFSTGREPAQKEKITNVSPRRVRDPPIRSKCLDFNRGACRKSARDCKYKHVCLNCGHHNHGEWEYWHGA